ncbi:hypothetical protein BO94DRAFT_619949 [Aspergillus sclerotioniger CBS 115572]|uniref:Retrovirus-related Pol polyprotein from transposon TNT 1-94-like beta-barrel domain-containing protein n=1 Tax=Aspergillus sclerotioniger CBS 115572 TaxID=1450535 RepID=A0A317XAJ3_9EURO|nr:hypothetical protein BO94DRAFT_619949 [Aspergillus sclerotioniger CBS 115572]PWY95529.1 hypothetical protein BO94DRAFT_619949 [Aspergillus sclerotioniger CBS 115572]
MPSRITPTTKTNHYQHYHPYNTTTTTKPSPRPRPRPHFQPQPQPRCFDWVLLPTNSNTHIAKNRSSFITYRRAPCKIANQRVLGIGTVQLRVQRAPDDPRTNTLVLHDVLHMPNARCNGISVAKYTGESEEGSGSEDGSEVMSDQGGSSAGERCVVGVEGDGRWFQGRGEGGGMEMGVDGLRVVLAGDGEREMSRGDGGGKMLGVVASKEELDMLNERVRNRSWV